MLMLVASGCQTEPEAPKGPQTYTAEFKLTEAYKIPTMVKWNTGSDSGTTTPVSVGDNNYQVSIRLASPPSGPVSLNLYRAGIHYSRLNYDYTDAPELKLNSNNVVNDLALELLRRLGEKATDSSAIAEVAKSLVEKDTVIKSDLILAGKLLGLDTAKVVKEALKLLVAKNAPLKDLVPSGKWILNIDTLSIHVRIRLMTDSGLLKADTTKLFPPYPMRLKTAVTLAAQLQAGGSAVAVTGAFEATTVIATLSTKVFQGETDKTNSFNLTTIDLLNRPQMLDLAGKLSITAKESTAPGTYRLEIVVQDDAGNPVKITVTFEVTSAADRIGPSIEIIAPEPFTILENATSTVAVKARVVDPSGVDSVWIDNRPASKVGDSWEISDVAIPVKDFGYNVLVIARDKAGNRDTNQVTVGRKNSSNANDPTTLLVSPAADAILPFDSSSVTVLWKVEDPRSPIAKVIIDGLVATKTPGNIWSRRVEIPATGKPTTITLLAINEAFQEITKSFQVTRKVDSSSTPAKDTDKPRIVRQTGTQDQSVAYNVSEVSLGWTVTDASPVQVTIQGLSVVAKDGVYGAKITLGTNVTVIRIEATDSAKNKAMDSVIIRRASEPGAPVVTRETGTKDSAVAYSVTSLKLAWKVTDATLVILNGTPVQGLDSIYTVQASLLKVGKNGYKLVAKNATGKETSDSITIVRGYHDSIAPVVVAGTGTKDTTVPNATETVVLSWKVTDNDKLQSVMIGGLVATATGDIYSATLPLKPGANIFHLVATDTAKNTSKDSVVVTRTPDAGAPVIAREPGTKDSTVAYSTTSVQLNWKVTDDVGVSSVEINGALVTGAAGIYSLEAKNLAIGKNGFKIVAKDAGGKSSFDTLTIIRIGDTSAPVILRGAGTKDSTVAYATTSVQLSWNVTDDVGISSVEINGAVATGTAGVYAFEAKNLAIGKNGFKIVAKDAAGKSSTDSVTIARAWKDTVAPAIVRSIGTDPKTVAYEDSTYTPAWTVTDTLLKEVTIQGVVATGTAGVYSSPIKLSLGRNLITITAKDQATNASSDTFSVMRNLGIIPDLTFSHAAGTHDSSFRVTIKSSITGAVIKYTVDNTDPTTSSTAMTYSSTVLIDRTRTLKAFATASNRTPSSVASRLYTLVLPSPIPSLPSGTTTDTVFSVNLSCRISNVKIYYTLDGSTPTTNSILAIPDLSSIEIDSIRTLKAIAIKDNWTNSPVAVLDFKANVPVKVFTSGASVIRADGSLWTLGSDGTLVNGSTGATSDYTKVMEDVKSITRSHILKNNGDLYAYGTNDYGEFGNGTTTGSVEPLFIKSGVKKVVDGWYNSFIIDNSDDLYAAGSNTNGNFCNETATSSSTYTKIRSGVADMATGYVSSYPNGNAWSLYVTTLGDAYGCGSGPLGTATGQVGTPNLLGSGYSAAFTTDGGSFFSGGSLLLKANGDAYSYSGATRFLVPNSSGSGIEFVRSDIKQIAGGDENVLMLDTYGNVWGAGNNVWGGLGDGTTETVSPPKIVMSDVKFIAGSGSGASLFIKKNGTLWATGGDLGNSPVRIRLP
ncbi:MAG: FN3 associated domain-containing protein [Fibrobacterota bacterium]